MYYKKTSIKNYRFLGIEETMKCCIFVGQERNQKTEQFKTEHDIILIPTYYCPRDCKKNKN